MVSKTFIWMRHAEKKYNNGKGGIWDKQHDPGIIESEEEIFRITDKLVDEYGVPEKILMSPFLRTRQTSEIIKKRLLQKYDKKIETVICNNVREYLGFCKNKTGYAELEYETETYLGGPVKLKETLTNLNLRIESHINSLNKNNSYVWVITHGLIISTIYRLQVGEEPKRPGPLNYLISDNNQISKNF